MKQARLLCVSLLLAATLWPAAAQAIGRKLPQHVKDLVAGPRVCTGKGIYTYTASWTPITWEASRCRIGGPGSWIAVKADAGLSGSGVRASAAPPSHCT